MVINGSTGDANGPPVKYVEAVSTDYKQNVNH